MGIGDWGLGFWVLGGGGKTPNPKPKPPHPKPQVFFFILNKKF